MSEFKLTNEIENIMVEAQQLFPEKLTCEAFIPWEGEPVDFVNTPVVTQLNSPPEHIKGMITEATYDENAKGYNVKFYIDKKSYDNLARALVQKYIKGIKYSESA